MDDSDCAMKVGTDAVLLACSVPPNQSGKILDIGSGSGLISLCLAQKNPAAEIFAVEIDHAAYLQSMRNFKNSTWNNRLNAVNTSIQNYARNIDLKFDYILCNPPFFKNNAQLSGSRKSARQDIDLTFSDLLYSVDCLIANTGMFNCILPTERSEEIIYLAEHFNFFPNFHLQVKGKKTLLPKRTILSFSRKAIMELEIEQMCVYDDDHSYTSQYREFTKEFYLKF